MQLVVIEQFTDKIPHDVREYLYNNEGDTVMKFKFSL